MARRTLKQKGARMHRLTIVLPEEVYRPLKVYCAQKDLTLQWVIETTLRRMFKIPTAEERKEGGEKRQE